MKYEMKLDDEPFKLTKSCDKTIEIRISDEKRKNINTHDLIEFINLSLGSIMTEVVQVNVYKDIDELILTEDFKKTGGLYKNKSEWREHILSYYPIELQRKCGVLSIEICVIK